MDFLKGLFKGKKAKSVEITVSRGQGLPPELMQLFGGGADHAGKYEPLFLVKAHPQVTEIFRAGRERRNFLEKEMEACQARIDAAHTEMWKSVEAYMQANGLWPTDVPLDGDPCLAIKNGVIMHHRHE